MPSFADPDAYLCAYHDRCPGRSPPHFGRGTTAEGGSSYDAVVRRVGAARRILDLGCGDGFLLERIAAALGPSCELIGVDMSAGELALAAQRPALRGAALCRGRAQALPVAAGACDVVVSHMAFMLMSEVDQVVRELARVLAPGGRFISAAGGGPAGEEAFHRFIALLDALPRTGAERAPRLGDRRARSVDGMGELFAPAAGFDRVEGDDLVLRLDGTVDEVWASLEGIYGVELLSAEHRAELGERFRAEAARLAGPDRTVPCAQWLRVFTVHRVG